MFCNSTITDLFLFVFTQLILHYQDFLTDENFKHKIDFDNQLLPYKIYETHIINRLPDTLFHWHPEVEISYIVEGTAQYHIDYDYFNSQSGDIILIRPNGMHSIHPINDHYQHSKSLLFHLDMVVIPCWIKSAFTICSRFKIRDLSWFPVSNQVCRVIRK